MYAEQLQVADGVFVWRCPPSPFPLRWARSLACALSFCAGAEECANAHGHAVGGNSEADPGSREARAAPTTGAYSCIGRYRYIGCNKLQ